MVCDLVSRKERSWSRDVVRNCGLQERPVAMDSTSNACYCVPGYAGILELKWVHSFQVYHYAARMNEQKDAILQAISSGEEAAGVMVFPIQDGEWLRDDLQLRPILGPWYTIVIWQGKVSFGYSSERLIL